MPADAELALLKRAVWRSSEWLLLPSSQVGSFSRRQWAGNREYGAAAMLRMSFLLPRRAATPPVILVTPSMYCFLVLPFVLYRSCTATSRCESWWGTPAPLPLLACRTGTSCTSRSWWELHFFCHSHTDFPCSACSSLARCLMMLLYLPMKPGCIAARPRVSRLHGCAACLNHTEDEGAFISLGPASQPH